MNARNDITFRSRRTFPSVVALVALWSVIAASLPWYRRLTFSDQVYLGDRPLLIALLCATGTSGVDQRQSDLTDLTEKSRISSASRCSQNMYIGYSIEL
jgi:hypothetical protein